MESVSKWLYVKFGKGRGRAKPMWWDDLNNVASSPGLQELSLLPVSRCSLPVHLGLRHKFGGQASDERGVRCEQHFCPQLGGEGDEE